jgi:hypothetical protein
MMVKERCHRPGSGFQNFLKSRKPEQSTARRVNPERVTFVSSPRHSWKPSAGTMQRRFANASLNDGRVSSLSAFALMHETAELLLVAQLFDEIPPQGVHAELILFLARMPLHRCRDASA